MDALSIALPLEERLYFKTGEGIYSQPEDRLEILGIPHHAPSYDGRHLRRHMGRITVNRTMAQFSCKLSCTPSLWNPRASRLEGKSKEAVETNKDIEQLLLSIQKAFDVLVEKRTDLPIPTIRDDTRSPASLYFYLILMD